MARLFVALGLPGDARKSLSSLLPGGIPSLRKTQTERLHLTLRVIGEANENGIAEALSGSEISENLTLNIRGTGLFGSEPDPKILWAGVEASLELRQLKCDIETRLLSAGLNPETRPWEPHITIARVRHSRALPSVERVRRDQVIHRFLAAGETFALPPRPIEAISRYASETLAGMLHYREVNFAATSLAK